MSRLRIYAIECQLLAPFAAAAFPAQRLALMSYAGDGYNRKQWRTPNTDGTVEKACWKDSGDKTSNEDVPKDTYASAI